MKISEIHPNPDQPRKHFAEGPLQELADSIAALGVLQPIAVTEDGMIVAGERRWRAAQMAGLTEIPVVVVEPNTEMGLFARSVAENLIRKDMTILEEVDAFTRMVEEFGMTPAEIAALIGTSTGQVTWKLGMRNLNPTLRPIAATSQLSSDMVWQLAQLDSERQMEVFRKWSHGDFANHGEFVAYCEAVKLSDDQEFFFSLDEVPMVTPAQQRTRDKTRDRLGMIGKAVEQLDEIFAADDATLAAALGPDAERLQVELDGLAKLISRYKRRAVKIEQMVNAGIGQARLLS